MLAFLMTIEDEEKSNKLTS